MTIGEHILLVADAGLALGNMVADEDIYTHLNVLLAIEEALDQGRVSSAALDSGKELIREINARMDKLRSIIAAIIDRCDQEEFTTYMEQRGRRMQYQFNKQSK